MHHEHGQEVACEASCQQPQQWPLLQCFIDLACVTGLLGTIGGLPARMQEWLRVPASYKQHVLYGFLTKTPMPYQHAFFMSTAQACVTDQTAATSANFFATLNVH